jgi:polysaccharide biosynthesis/export protein
MKRTPTVCFVLAGLLAGPFCGDVSAFAARRDLAAQSGQSQAGQAKPAPEQPASQAKPPSQAPKAKPPGVAPVPTVAVQSVPPPPGYVIGPDDVLLVQYWREKEVSAEVVVRPDGMISLPLLNDLKAAGLTPDQLRDAVNEAAKKFFQEDPSVTIIIKTINSRKVFITGSVTRPGPYPLTAPTTVLQLISTAGGLTEFAKQTKISVMRNENGKLTRYPFNYKDVAQGKNLQQNIELRPGDTVIVP